MLEEREPTLMAPWVQRSDRNKSWGMVCRFIRLTRGGITMPDFRPTANPSAVWETLWQALIIMGWVWCSTAPMYLHAKSSRNWSGLWQLALAGKNPKANVPFEMRSPVFHVQNVPSPARCSEFKKGCWYLDNYFNVSGLFIYGQYNFTCLELGLRHEVDINVFVWRRWSQFRNNHLFTQATPVLPSQAITHTKNVD